MTDDEVNKDVWGFKKRKKKPFTVYDIKNKLFKLFKASEIEEMLLISFLPSHPKD